MSNSKLGISINAIPLNQHNKLNFGIPHQKRGPEDDLSKSFGIGSPGARLRNTMRRRRRRRKRTRWRGRS